MNYSFEHNNEIEGILAASADRQRLEGMLEWLHSRLNELGLQITDYRWTSLANHISAMIGRSQTGDRLPPMDMEMFVDVDVESIALADEITGQIGGLKEDEKYLLSVHFAAAKL